MNLRKLLRIWCTPNLTNLDCWIERIAKDVPRDSVVLDVGAGSAPYRRLFQHCRYLTQDAAALDPKKLRDKAFTALDYVCDAASIPIASRSVDVILCTEVLEHVPEPIKVLEEFSRIIRIGGKVFLSAPLGSGIHQEPYHFYGGYTPYFYSYVARQMGFRVEYVESNGVSAHHLRQWCLWAALSIWRNRRMGSPIWYLFVVISLPFWCFAAVMADWFGSFVKDSKFSFGYHVALVRLP